MSKKIKVEARFLGFKYNNLKEMIISNEIYRKDVTREIVVGENTLDVMKTGQKKGWFYVKELETINPVEEKVVWDPKPVAESSSESSAEIAEDTAEAEKVAEESIVEDTVVEEAPVEDNNTVVETETEEVAAEEIAETEEVVTEETDIDFSAMKKAELIQYAKDNNIEIPEGATVKEIKEILENR